MLSEIMLSYNPTPEVGCLELELLPLNGLTAKFGGAFVISKSFSLAMYLSSACGRFTCPGFILSDVHLQI